MIIVGGHAKEASYETILGAERRTMTYQKHIIICLASLLFAGMNVGDRVSAETLVMGYKTSAKLPLIAEDPDQTGIYEDLYTQAAQKINCELIIKRGPKKRIFLEMQGRTIE